jgi:hypothetical protein
MNRGRAFLLFSFFLAVVVMGGCATMPTGPSVTVLPGPGKSFEAFQSDDFACRQWAEQQIGISPGNAANQNLAGGAALGTLIGAGLGAAVGAAYGNAGAGAAIGADTKSRGDTTLPISNACMRREIKSPVSYGPPDKVCRLLHRRAGDNLFRHRIAIRRYLLIINKGARSFPFPSPVEASLLRKTSRRGTQYLPLFFRVG